MSQTPMISFLSSVDTSMAPDHTRSSPLVSRILPESNMSTLGNNPQTAPESFWPAHYASASCSIPKVSSSFHDPPESAMSFQDYNLYQTDQDFPNMEGTFTSSGPGEQAFWNFNSLNGSNSLMAPNNDSSYVISHNEHHQLHEAVINPRRIRTEAFPIPVPNNYDSAGESFRSSSSSRRSSPSIKRKFSGANNPDVTRSPVTINGEESDEDGSSNSEPYAQLIYRALKSVAGHAMVLKDLYEWFETNTDKAKDPSSKGWQNSIRHNLSMNGAFKKVEQVSATDESKKGYIWVLEESALIEGVKSTTRYRKHNPHKKPGKVEVPAPQRQRSGAKGGKAAKKAAKMKRSTRMDEIKPCQFIERNPAGYGAASIMEMHAPGTADISLTPDTSPYYLHTSASPAESLVLEENPYGYSNAAIGTSASADETLFYDTGNDLILTCGPFYDPEGGFLKS